MGDAPSRRIPRPDPRRGDRRRPLAGGIERDG
jgi:hypothetical protein